jgi:Mg-chelatase subunit ChlD
MRDLESFTPNLDKSKRQGGDLADGLTVALQMITKHCGTKKYRKRIFLITDGERKTE